MKKTSLNRRQFVEGMSGNRKNFIFQLEQHRINQNIVQGITGAKPVVDSQLHEHLNQRRCRNTAREAKDAVI